MNTGNVTLDAGEVLVVDQQELLQRQIAEWMVQAGEILTYVFGPSTADQGKPSYTRASVISAQDARNWHHENATSRSTGVWGVTVDEVFQAQRHVIDDSGTPLEVDEVRPPGHCFIDFRGLAKPEIKSIRYLLYQRAMARKEIATDDPAGQNALF